MVEQAVEHGADGGHVGEELAPVLDGVWSGNWICLNSRWFVTAGLHAGESELTRCGEFWIGSGSR